ncbi:hypothetical protein BDY19DRAFT_993227 [Irpex rosettiformis]|uniref:Uncharacterized protein n=1 Tax=Irpex rosettiformis TaxID=378272 RepID=A0ACB8U5V5_9APHY|nr:hypothetical protein BDY19DRAFT_993227 [Irpex rosettiformis]
MPNGTDVTPPFLPTPPAADVVSYTIAAFSTLLVYDFLLCLPDEVTLVWSRATNPRSWMYFLNRYLPFVDTFISLRLLTTIQPPDVCEREFKVVTWMIVVGVFIAESILMLRTYAIFERRKWMLILLCSLLAGIAIPSFVVVKLELDSVHYGFPRRGPYQGCTLIADTSVIIIVAYLLVLFSETVVFVLTLYKAIKDWIIYYVYTFLISFANVLVPIVGPPELDNWLATPQRVLHSIFCGRILLSILRNGNISATDTSNISGGTSTGGSTLGFRKPGSLPIAGVGRTMNSSHTRGTVFSSVEDIDAGGGGLRNHELEDDDNDILEDGHSGPEELEMSDLVAVHGVESDGIVRDERGDIEAGPIASSSRMKLEDELTSANIPRIPTLESDYD